MHSLPGIRAVSKGLTLHLIQHEPAIPDPRIARAVWLRKRYTFTSPEVAELTAELAFHNGGRS